MKFLNILAASAVAILLAPAAPVAAQNISPSAAWSCTFPNAPSNCGFSEQSLALPRATINGTVARDGSTSIQLNTLPGDSNVDGSGTNERDDLEYPPTSGYCNQGQEEWWAHSVYFPDGYVVPPSGSTWNWGVVFDFHHTGSSGQPNFEIASIPTGLVFQIAGGSTIVNGPSDPGYYSVPIGPVVKDTWYDFVYHIKWSSNSDGYFQAWVNGVQKMNFSGPTLYAGQACYLKLANYHTPLGVPVSVIHDRVVFGTTQTAVALAPLPAAPVKRAVADDFNGDGMSDILWRDSLTGQDAIWFMNGGVLSSGPFITTVSDLNWQIAGTGDFNGDGMADILWRNKSTGQNQVWLMNGGTITAGLNITTMSNSAWTVAGIGDFDGDGKSDILWRNNSSGQNQIWFMNGATVVNSPNISKLSDLNWIVAAVGDFDGNGKSDILWRNKSTGQNQVWFMNGATQVSGPSINAVTDLNWSVVGAGDFDGDGKSDVLWRNKVTGENAIFFMNGATVLSTTFITQVSDLNWAIAGVGDFNGDGKSDILWRNASTSQEGIFFMNAGTVTSTVYLSNVPTEWSIALR
ncbi:MAG TPA: FG-GAP-like repeat-containing protein [Burkholderiales bacterium]|nr:FG-GAP-like repeat-containing protein [Burkholderiales bacterium]